MRYGLKKILLTAFVVLSIWNYHVPTAYAKAKTASLSDRNVDMVVGKMKTISLKQYKKLSKKQIRNVDMVVGKMKTISLKQYKKLSKKQIKKVKWSSSNKKVVTVKVKGKYRQKATLAAKAPGNAVVRLRYNNKVYKCKVSVREPQWVITQYASTTGNQQMFYTIVDDDDNLIIIDGGYTNDAEQVRSVIAEHDNHVTAWILTHPHPDHGGAFNVIAADCGDIVIDQIYATPVHYGRYHETARYYDGFDTYEEFLRVTEGAANLNYLYENDELDILGLHMKVLHAWDNDTNQLNVNLCNNGGLCFTISGAQEKMLFCADIDKNTEQFILQHHMEDLNVDYIQASHHGNWGMTQEFYQYTNPKAVFFDSSDALLTPGEAGYDAGLLKAYFEGRGIPVYNFSTAPNQIIIR